MSIPYEMLDTDYISRQKQIDYENSLINSESNNNEKNLDNSEIDNKLNEVKKLILICKEIKEEEQKIENLKTQANDLISSISNSEEMKMIIQTIIDEFEKDEIKPRIK